MVLLIDVLWVRGVKIYYVAILRFVLRCDCGRRTTGLKGAICREILNDAVTINNSSCLLAEFLLWI